MYLHGLVWCLYLLYTKPVQAVEIHFDPTTPIDMIVDVEGEGVTLWKTILSLFLMFGANGFEGVRWGAGFGDGWRWVCRVNRK